MPPKSVCMCGGVLFPEEGEATGRAQQEELGVGEEASAWALRVSPAQTQRGKGQGGTKGWRAQALWYVCGRGPAGCGCSVDSVARGQNTRTRSLLAGMMHLGKGALLGEHSPRGAWPGECRRRGFARLCSAQHAQLCSTPTQMSGLDWETLAAHIQVSSLQPNSVCPTVPAQDPASCSNKMQRGTRVAAPQLAGRG